ncbi:MAG: DUF1772 domain-containing protein [Candidatus Korobacteraceae bacterium]
MLYAVLQVVTIVAAGLMVGNELAVAAFLHPTLRRLPDDVHAPARIAFAGLFGWVMPFWYALVLLLTAATFYAGPALSSITGKLLLTSSVLWLLAIVFSLIFPAPLNSRIAAWQVKALPATWRSDALRWDRLHALRMGILFAALVCLVASAVASG